MYMIKLLNQKIFKNKSNIWFLIHNILDLINFPNEINLAFQDLKNDKLLLKTEFLSILNMKLIRL